MSKNQLTKNLFEIIASKKTNLSIAADVTDIDDLLQVSKRLWYGLKFLQCEYILK